MLRRGRPLLQEPDRPALAARPVPIGQARQATLEGTAVAMTDGAEALQQQGLSHVPPHPLGLDMLHATESLWDPAHALLGETHPGRPPWGRTHLEQGRAGQTDTVRTALAAEANDPRRTETQRRAILRPVGSYQRNPKTIASIGVGLRWAATLAAPIRLRSQFEVYWGYPLKDVDTPGGDLQDLGLHLQFVVTAL